jgi:hypothetical protein
MKIVGVNALTQNIGAMGLFFTKLVSFWRLSAQTPVRGSLESDIQLSRW